MRSRARRPNEIKNKYRTVHFYFSSNLTSWIHTLPTIFSIKTFILHIYFGSSQESILFRLFKNAFSQDTLCVVYEFSRYPISSMQRRFLVHATIINSVPGDCAISDRREPSRYRASREITLYQHDESSYFFLFEGFQNRKRFQVRRPSSMTKLLSSRRRHRSPRTHFATSGRTSNFL